MTSIVVFRYAAAVMAVVGGLKVVILDVEAALEGEFQPPYAPWGFVLIFWLPFVVVWATARRRPRSAAVVMILASIATLIFLGFGLVQAGFIVTGWSDPLVAYVGTLAVAVGLVAAVRFLVTRPVVAAH